MQAQKFHVAKGDTVMVIAGKEKTKTGTVQKVLPKKNGVIVEGLNMVKRHVKPNPYRREVGGIIDKEMPIHISNVMVVCNKCSTPTRIGYKYAEDGKKMRFCKKCNQTL